MDQRNAECFTTDVRKAPSLQLDEALIARLAFLAWEAEGRPEGQDERLWLETESQLKANWTSLVGEVMDGSALRQADFPGEEIAAFLMMNPAAEPNPLSHEEINAGARSLWVQAGCPPGRDLEFWLSSKARLMGERREESVIHSRTSPAKAEDQTDGSRRRWPKTGWFVPTEGLVTGVVMP